MIDLPWTDDPAGQLKTLLLPDAGPIGAHSIILSPLNLMAASLYELSYAVAYITFALGILSSIARFYCRALVVKSWGWDDTASGVVLVSRYRSRNGQKLRDLWQLVNITHQVVLQLFLDLRCGK